MSMLTDGLGSTLAATDVNGSVAGQYAYEPFGNTVATGNLSTNSLQFIGRENDGATGLFYFRARYYSPKLQRFISPDPLGIRTGNMNPYAYANNDPRGATEPLWSPGELSRV